MLRRTDGLTDCQLQSNYDSENSLLSTTGKLFENVILKIVQRHIKEINILNACQSGFRARHSTTLQCMKLTDHVILNFNNNISTAAVLLDIEKAFDTWWHLGLLYKLSELHFSSNLMKLISSFLSNRKFRVMVEGELPTSRDIQAGVPQISVLSPTPFSLYINDAPQTPLVYLGRTLCRWSCVCVCVCVCVYTYIRSQRGLCSQKNWHLTGIVMWTLEHEDQWR
jgi:hypothetical protein